MKKKIFFKSETLSLARLINCQIKKSHINLLSLLKVLLRVLKSARIHSIPPVVQFDYQSLVFNSSGNSSGITIELLI